MVFPVGYVAREDILRYLVVCGAQRCDVTLSSGRLPLHRTCVLISTPMLHGKLEVTDPAVTRSSHSQTYCIWESYICECVSASWAGGSMPVLLYMHSHMHSQMPVHVWD
jgi:hypothetical protein